ncbi:MAG: efflux RND transporter permease subunit, partial [Rhizobiales bacterium]|nr:efflux RND transporter permease subunit [Hyphomicrobiales bacterium]
MSEQRPADGPADPQGHEATARTAASLGGISALSVRRPVLAIVANLLIVVAGLAAFGGIEIRELPNIDQPVVTITTTYTGASPDTMDKEVTSVIENAAAGVSGWTDIQSQ